MRYDEGYGRHGGWEMRMPDGGRGWDRGYPDAARGGDPADRPWVGGYREGYQGGSGGYALGTSGPLYEEYGASGDPPRHERGYRRPRGQEGRGRHGGNYFVRARASEYGGDYGGRGGGDRFAYEDPAGDTGFGASNPRPGFGRLGHLGGGYGGDFRGGQGGAQGRGYGGDFREGQGGGQGRGQVGSYGGDFREGHGGGQGRGQGGGYGADPGRQGGAYGGDYDRGMRGGGGGYDLPFRNQGRPEDYHPRYSPVGGMYAPLGGAYMAYRAGRVPRPLQDTWTSEWTRWF